jgi:hypothetical protein
MARSVVIGTVTLACKSFVKLGTLETFGTEQRLLRLLEGNVLERPLITVSNHSSVIDDPLLFAGRLVSVDEANYS